MGNTALHFCHEFGYKALAEYLIKKGANIEIKSIKGFPTYKGLQKKKDAP